jgi:hypothetical protein
VSSLGNIAVTIHHTIHQMDLVHLYNISQLFMSLFMLLRASAGFGAGVHGKRTVDAAGCGAGGIRGRGGGAWRRQAAHAARGG